MQDEVCQVVFCHIILKPLLVWVVSLFALPPLVIRVDVPDGSLGEDLVLIECWDKKKKKKKKT